MLKVDLYSAKGVKATTTVSLPKEWETDSNERLLAQAIRVYTDRLHVGLRKAQTRAEVNRTKKKLYKQKGTGGARHGSRRAPIFVGGGVAHGPRPITRELVLSKQMKRRSVALAITQAIKEERVLASDVKFSKTGDVARFIKKVVNIKSQKVTFVLGKENLKMEKFMRNIENVKVLIFPSINAYDIFFGGTVVFDKNIFKKEDK